jgi:predicted nucleic acid-binding protein
VKLVLDEPGTDEARELREAATSLYSSRLLGPETHAAVAQATRDARFSAGGANRAFELLANLLEEVAPVELDEGVAEHASELAVAHALRGADAIHLASFERLDVGAAMLVTSDSRLARAAGSRSHAVAVPG